MEVLMRIPFAIKPPKGGVRGKVEIVSNFGN